MPPPQGFQWGPALVESFFATAIAHTVRVTTEDDTQSKLGGPFWPDYVRSIENIHGWDDGDAFYTTWILHPMEGSLAGFIEQQNDPAYRDVEFSASQRYWISRMRALAFSTLYSIQWTMGPISEASIGNVQHYDPPGVNDLVVTPIVGIAWMIGEDAVDRYVIKWIENHTHNSIINLLARSTLNPTRSYANLLRLKVPWYRDSRGGVLHWHDPPVAATLVKTPEAPFSARAWPKSVAFELSGDAVYQRFLGSTGSNCIGGQGKGAVKLSQSWAMVGNFGGCELMGFTTSNASGDALWYTVGARYSHDVAFRRLRSYVEALGGGMKITHDFIDEQKKEQLIATALADHKIKPNTSAYTTEKDTNAPSVQMGMGLIWDLNNGAVIRVCDFNYQHSWTSHLDGMDYNDGLRVSTGVSVRFGHWNREH
jgi:hypothetical protein